jgi:hypothetical protein
MPELRSLIEESDDTQCIPIVFSLWRASFTNSGVRGTSGGCNWRTRCWATCPTFAHEGLKRGFCTIKVDVCGCVRVCVDDYPGEQFTACAQDRITPNGKLFLKGYRWSDTYRIRMVVR